MILSNWNKNTGDETMELTFEQATILTAVGLYLLILIIGIFSQRTWEK